MGSFVTDPDDGSFTQIPWYLMNNVDLNSSQRTLTQSQISNQTFKSLVQRFESLKMSQSSQVQPDDLYEREQRRKTLDANRYATKKTIAQGMLDVALLTANASQLKYVLQVGENVHPFYHLMLALIIVSIVLQVIVGILFLVIGGLNINDDLDQRTADILNDVITVLVFLITLVNIVINGFGIRTTDVIPKNK